MSLEEVMTYIPSELLILIPVLYAVGFFVKKSQSVADKFIPLILGGVGIVVCWLFEFMTIGFGFEAVFNGIIRGILCAGVTVYINQVKKQVTKAE